ncbi:MAG: hypothetical protein ACR2M0_06385 [Chloroflexia bacterium]
MLGIVRVLSILLILVGVIWVGQGMGYIKGSFMTNDPFWGWTGLVCLLVGGALAYWGFFHPQPRP